MQPLDKSKSNSNFFRFVVLFVAGLFAGFLLTYFITSLKKTTNAGDAGTARVLSETDSLKTEFDNLQSLNSSYSSILEKSDLDTTQLFYLDSLNSLITNRELAFLEHLDNIEIVNSSNQNSSSGLLKSIVDGFRIAAKQSTAVSAIRNSFNIGNTNYSFDQKMLATMQRELRTKEVELVMLQKQRKGSIDTMDRNLTATLAADSVASNAVLVQRSKNETLTAVNKKLQNDILQLKKQLLTINAKTQTSNNAVSSQLNNYTNEQVSLVKADCYLTRADANQIISNARQRTELLQSALQILNSLSNSESDAVRKQAQTKLADLKKIAANNHD